MRGGVYIYRTNKPGAIFGWPIFGRHFGYVGETVSFAHRHKQHLDKQPWSDLRPHCYRIPLPGWKWLLHAVETLLILVLMPVYNHKKNLWNPRRIPLDTARLLRRERDGRSLMLSVVLRAALAVRLILFLAVLAGAAYVVRKVTS